MDNLSDVCSCLRALDSSKATDRKKNATRVQQLLDTNSVRRVLDGNSDEHRAITWDGILKGVNKYVEIELSTLRSAKESQSATTLSNRDKKKHELADLFKFVVKAANQRGARLTASLLIDSILKVLHDEYTLDALGADYSNILLKCVLRERAYWLRLTPAQWRKLLHIYCKLFEEEAFDRDVVVRIIQELVTGNTLQGELNPKRLFSFFSRVMEHISEVRSPSVVENLLAALNNFCENCAPGCRAQLCGFGESRMGAFIGLWEKASTEKIKEQLVTFFHLLVRTHHPHGVTKSAEGAFAIDWPLWQSQLVLLHELIMTDMDLLAGSYKIMSGSKDSGLKASYISFVADIFRQLSATKIVPETPNWSLTQPTQFTWHAGAAGGANVSAIGASGITPAKRQRLSPEKKSLLEVLRETSGSLQAVPWLQVLHQLLARYPRMFDEPALNTTLELLVNMLGRCKRGPLYQHLFACLSALTTALHRHGTHSPEVAELMAALWSHCLSTINSRQAGVEGYQEHGFTAMATVVRCGYVQPRPEIWNLFLPGLCQPCAAADELLTTLVCQGLPENHTPSIVGTSSTSETGPGQSQLVYPLRRCLVRWLLSSCDQAGGVGESFRQPGLSPRRVAEILHALTLQDLTAVLGKCVAPSSDSASTFQPHNTLESLYLDNLFERQDCSGHGATKETVPNRSNKGQPQHHSSHIPVVMEFLTKHLQQTARSVDNLEPGIQALELSSWLSCMLAHLWRLLRSSHSRGPVAPPSGSNRNNNGVEVVTNSNTAGSYLSCADTVEKALCSVMEKCVTMFVSHTKRESWSGGLGSTLRHLCSMLDWDREQGQQEEGEECCNKATGTAFHVAEVVRSALPASFVDLLVDIMSGKQATKTEGKKARGRSSMGRARMDGRDHQAQSSSCHTDDLDMDMFDLFDGGGPGHGQSLVRGVSDEEDDDMDLGLDTSARSTSAVKNTRHLLCENSLTEAEQVQLSCVRLLARLTSFDHRQAQALTASVSRGLPTVGMDSDYVKSKMLERVSFDCFDPTSALDVHVLMTITDLVLNNEHHITDADVKAILRAVKQAAKEQQKDQAVCYRLVASLRHVVPHLNSPQGQQGGDSPPSEGLQLCRDFFFKILSSFWQLACEGTTPLKLSVAELLLDLVKHDPDCTWGHLMVEANESADTDGRDSPGFTLCTVGQQFPRLLLESSVVVRAFVARSLNWLFVGRREGALKDKKTQIKIFDDIFMLCSELLSLEQDSSALHSRDELSNGQATFLHVLLTIVKCSPVCEKQCLLGLFQMVSDKEISLQLVRKMLLRACTHLSYPGVQEYLASHLPYLVYNWLHEGMVGSPLEEFPFQLMGYSSVSGFTRAHPDLVVSMLLATKQDLGPVKAALTRAGLDIRASLLSALPDTLVHILPPFAVKAVQERPQGSGVTVSSSSQQTLGRQFQTANRCFAALKQGLSEEEINENVCERLGVIVVKVLSCLQVKGHAADAAPSVAYPDPNPPFYTEDKILATLDYLAKNFNDDGGGGGGDEFSLVGVLAKIPNGLHQVFLSLSSLLWQERHAHARHRRLQMAAIFVRLVLQELRSAQGSGKVMGSAGSARVMVRDILNRILVILLNGCGQEQCDAVQTPSYEEDLTLSCLSILHDVCCAVLNSCPQELVQFVHRIVDVVAGVSGRSKTVGQSALRVLQKLTSLTSMEDDDHHHHEVTCPPELRDAVRLLNPLPPVAVLAGLRDQRKERQDRSKALDELLGDFLTVYELTGGFPSQGLALRLDDLSCSISRRQDGVGDLASTEKGLSQLRAVIQHLSSLTASPCLPVSSAAASCLGAIGPVNLRGLSLARMPGTAQPSLELYRGQEYEKYCWLFHALDTSLMDESLEVVSTASGILQGVMATESSRQFEKHFIKQTKGQKPLFHCLQPFKNCQMDLEATSPHEPRQAFSTVDRPDLWLGEASTGASQTHEAWVKALVAALLSSDAVKDELLQKIRPLCALKVEFCESSLPYLIHDILKEGKSECRDILSRQFTAFFHTHCVQNRAVRQTHSKYPIAMNKKSLRTMLAVVQFLRTQQRPQQSVKAPHTAWHNNLWLDLDYLEVATAAQNCGASFSAVLYTEIYWGMHRQAIESGQSQHNNNSSSTSGSQDQSSLPCLMSPQVTEGCQGLLMRACKNIGDPDGIYGCGAGRQADLTTRVETYLQELQQERALTSLDIAMCNDPSLSVTPLLQVLQSCGADFVLRRCLPSIERMGGVPSQAPGSSQLQPMATDQLDEFRYQAAWKLGQWDLCLPQRQSSTAPFHQSVYRCLMSLRDGHLGVAGTALQAARLGAVADFDPGVETCSHLYPFVSQLQCLGYLDLVLKRLHHPEDRYSITSDHAVTASDQWTEFRFRQALLEIHSAAGRTLAGRGEKEGEAMEVDALWGLARGGRKAGHFQVAERAVQTLKLKLGNAGGRNLGLTQEKLQLEEAKLFWARGEVDVGKNNLHSLLQSHTKSQGRLSQNREDATYLEGLVLYGNWLAETKSETPSIIIDDFFQKAVDMIRGRSDNSVPDKTALQAFVSLAVFADEQHQQLVDYMRSPVYEEKRRLLRQSKTEVEEFRKLKVQNRITLLTIEKNFAIDEQELTALQEDRERFLHQALDGYLQCLRRGTRHDLRISRVIALWFDNCATATVNKMIERYVPSIPSHKFLLLFYQLAARMGSPDSGTDGSGFQPTLNKLLERVAYEHPHHALWVVLALAHAHRDSEFMGSDKGQGRRGGGRRNSAGEAVQEDRVHAAKELLERVSRSDPRRSGARLDQVVDAMRRFSLACIQLANLPVEKKAVQSHSLPQTLAIAKLQNLENIQIPIVDLAVDPSGSYTDLVSLVKFERSFRTAGGVNLPKIICCIGSDGVKRTTLVKGRDDLRQDAVMQQVFSLVNQLLAADQDTRHRQLSVRTYKVIPLSQNSGLLQWCEGTMPLGDYLAGRQGDAHSRYNPQDWKVVDCRKHLHESGSLPDKRYKAYQEICSHFHPVFRHFFLERFLEPDLWFERRLAYTRSVATNSIVGYILGLGDRHVNNILIDLKTAELVHIDFGIAFERGRILPTPETVPFRLTRDIVDGMGIPGVEGVFRRCCEKMMQVMKNNSEALLTIVQVLLHDPLSHWSLTPEEALALQRKREQAATDTVDLTLSGQVPSSGMVTQSGQQQQNGDPGVAPSEPQEKRNKVAERTLLRLRQKLCGQEDGVPLSVAGQVNLLIQKATDPHNLSRLFVGWQPYL